MDIYNAGSFPFIWLNLGHVHSWSIFCMGLTCISSHEQSSVLLNGEGCLTAAESADLVYPFECIHQLGDATPEG